jgi:hypothetical protein
MGAILSPHDLVQIDENQMDWFKLGQLTKDSIH